MKICPDGSPITGISPAPAVGTWKISAVTGPSFTELRPTSGTPGRASKLSGDTGALRRSPNGPAIGKILQQYDVGAEPGAISPRSINPKPRAADHVAAR